MCIWWIKKIKHRIAISALKPPVKKTPALMPAGAYHNDAGKRNASAGVSNTVHAVPSHTHPIRPHTDTGKQNSNSLNTSSGMYEFLGDGYRNRLNEHGGGFEPLGVRTVRETPVVLIPVSESDRAKSVAMSTSGSKSESDAGKTKNTCDKSTCDLPTTSRDDPASDETRCGLQSCAFSSLCFFFNPFLPRMLASLLVSPSRRLL